MKIAVMILLWCAFTLGAHSQIKNAQLQATGLTCSMCSKAVLKKLQGLAFVEKVVVDLNKSQYQITFKTDSAIALVALKTAVEDAGFAIGQLIVQANLPDNFNIADNAVLNIYGNAITLVEAQKKAATNSIQFKIISKGYVTTKEYKKWQKKYANNANYLNGTALFGSVLP
jgi:copper chaperone CopZ